jgi:hypothetical protein
MFPTPTVFIIGAGAGKDIGMPVGSELSLEIAEKLNIKHKDHSQELSSGEPELSSALRRLAKERNEDYNDWRAAGTTVAQGIAYTRSIDAYLNTHKDNTKIKICGKLAIAHTILAHEKSSALHVQSSGDFADRKKVEQSWLSDLLYLMQDQIVASENLDRIFDNLCIVNFNYDRCVEHFLFYALQHLYQINKSRATQLMQRLVVFHPYGQVGFMQWDPTGRRPVDFGASACGELVELSGEIRTLNEQLEDEREPSEIRKHVGDALRIIFLGFHFHHQNMELLKASGPGRGGIVNSYATAFARSQADKNLIDRQIHQLLSERAVSSNVFVEGSDCRTSSSVAVVKSRLRLFQIMRWRLRVVGSLSAAHRHDIGCWRWQRLCR